MGEPIRVTRGGTYTPAWGNEGREEKDKIRGHYRFISFARQQELLEQKDVDKPFAFEGKVLAEMLYQIDNLEVEDENGVRPITTGHELINDPAVDRLALEFWQELRNKTAVDKKK